MTSSNGSKRKLVSGVRFLHDRFPATGFVRDVPSVLRWLSAMVFVTTVFVLANHLLLRGVAVGKWDVDGQFFAYQVLVADYARAGRFIYWDPWSNGGLPMLGDPQVGAFSPINVLIGFVMGGTSLGFKVYWLFVWWLGGFGILMLARHLRAPAWGGAVVALGFLFCGLYTNNAEHTAWITGFSFLPLIVWRLDAALCSGKRQPGIEAGALWGLSALAGYPGYTIITGCFVVLWATGRWLFAERDDAEDITTATHTSTRSATDKPRRSIWFVFSVPALVFVVGIVVLSPTYLAFFHEGAGTHTRTGVLDRDYAVVTDALHPSAIATFASSYFTILKQANTEHLWLTTSAVMSNLYSGAIVFALAVFAVFKEPRDRWRWWLVGLALLGFGCACGQALPLRGWLYDWFYPMRFFRHPGIFRSYYIFAVAIIALIGTRDLASATRCKHNRQVWSRFLIASVVTASGALLTFAIVINSVLIVEQRSLGYSHVALMWLGICGVAVFGRFARDRRKQSGVPLLLLFLATSDVLLTTRMSQGTMLEKNPEYVGCWRTLDEKHVANLDLTNNGLRREESACFPQRDCVPDPPRVNLNNDQMITKVPVFNSYATNTNDFHLAMTDNPILRRVATGSERIFFATNAQEIAVTTRNFAEFVSRTEVLGAPPLVIHSAEELVKRIGEHHHTDGSAPRATTANIVNLRAIEKIDVELGKYAPEELVFKVVCPTDGWLLVTDRWARSWQAEVNGRATDVYPANFIFRAIRVTAGENEIRFTYRPFGFPWLILMSWGTLFAITSVSIYGCVATIVLKRGGSSVARRELRLRRVAQ